MYWTSLNSGSNPEIVCSPKQDQSLRISALLYNIKSYAAFITQSLFNKFDHSHLSLVILFYSDIDLCFCKSIWNIIYNDYQVIEIWNIIENVFLRISFHLIISLSQILLFTVLISFQISLLYHRLSKVVNSIWLI